MSEPTPKVLVPVPADYADRPESERLGIAGDIAEAIQEALT